MNAENSSLLFIQYKEYNINSNKYLEVGYEIS